MRIQKTTPLYNNTVAYNTNFKSFYNPVRNAAELGGNKNLVQKTAAKMLVKFYQYLGGYSQDANRDLEKLLARNDISFKKLLLYIHSGGLHFRELLHAERLEDISLKDRKSLLKKIVKDDMVVFELNRYIFEGLQDVLPIKYYPKKLEKCLLADFPLLPKNDGEYAQLLEKLVSSLGMKSDKLSTEQIEKFNAALTRLTESLLTDDSSKLQGLDEIFECIPEFKSTVGRKQHAAHDFDVFKHSLNVLKNIAEDEGFKNLNQSDKKVMMLAALMHDITKKEGVIDERHPFDSSMEAYFISKRFNLTEDEEIKLYKLIKNHEWLKYINIESKDKRNYRMMHVSWELMKDNLFDMALMFTHADLKSVKADGSFHDSKLGKAHLKLDGEIRSFGEAADIYAKIIKNRINNLQQSQPILPMTKFPKANRIKQAIQQINADGSTDIKGVYVDKDGLVILNFNEVEDWEKIGFPKGSSTKGIKIHLDNGQEVETGNIKFLAHGLSFENQLARFCAFALPDSNALLSVSYAERPETKYRFFRPQGLLGYTDTFNIIGGGEVDAGSGFKKSLRHFRDLLEYTECRDWRPFAANLIKKASGMTDEEYQRFVLENQNKSYTEIYPENIKEIMIKTFGSMKSNKRRGAREYNEFCTSQFHPMSPYAYNLKNVKIENPIEFLNGEALERTAFLRKYALNHDLPFTVFCNDL